MNPYNTLKQLAAGALVSLLFAMSAATALAQALPQPDGRVVLTVSGAVENTNAKQRVDFDMEMLKALPAATFETTTPWTDGVTHFEGVLVRDVLDKVGATGATATAVALNDYQFEIPTDDFDQYSVMLAYQMNGEQLRIRDKGPLWIVYPIDDHTELQNEQTHNKMVWQLRELIID